MTLSFDDLVKFLNDQVALRGESGTSVDDLRRLIEQCYRSAAQVEDDGASSSLPVVEDGSSQALVDEHLVSKVWSWIIRNPDIRVEKRKSAHERSDQAASSSTAIAPAVVLDQQDVTANTLHTQQGPSRSPPIIDQNAVLVASQNIMWQALTGHGVDVTRVKPMEFTLLSYIGAAGPSGIPQTELIAQSGQDKRSLPHRTDMLAERGYITKKPCRVKGFNTTLLTLKRFDKLSVEEVEETIDPISATPQELYEYIFPPGQPCALRRLVEVVVALLDTVDVMTAKTLRARTGISAHKLSARNLFIHLYRLELLGIVQRIGMSSSPGGTIYLHSVKLLKKPDAATIERFLYFTGKDEEELVQARKSAGEGSANIIGAEPALEAVNPILGAAALRDDNEEVDQMVETTRILPQWTPEKPLAYTSFEVVDAAGPQGLSTMDFGNQSFGMFYRRPIDHILSHLTDMWQKSQPPHLRHLAIVRDTRTENKTQHYLYRTYGNFEQAVANEETSWEAIGWSPQQEKVKLKDAVDEHGFPAVSPAKLHARTGASPAATIRAAFKFERQNRSFLRNYVNKTPLVLDSELLRNIDVTPSTRAYKAIGNKPIGRPRKYPKGQEPYRSGSFYKGKDLSAYRSKLFLQASQLAIAELTEAERRVLDAPKRKGRPPKSDKELTKPRKRALLQPMHEEIIDPGPAGADESLNGAETGSKRAATDGPEGEPEPKRQALSIEERRRQLQARLDDRVKVLQEELLTKARPGLYIAPPGSTTRALLESSLVVVVKSARLDQLPWFKASNDLPKLIHTTVPPPSQSIEPRSPSGTATHDTTTSRRARKRRRLSQGATPVDMQVFDTQVLNNTVERSSDRTKVAETPSALITNDNVAKLERTSELNFFDQLVAAANSDESHSSMPAKSKSHEASGASTAAQTLPPRAMSIPSTQALSTDISRFSRQELIQSDSHAEPARQSRVTQKQKYTQSKPSTSADHVASTGQKLRSTTVAFDQNQTPSAPLPNSSPSTYNRQQSTSRANFSTNIMQQAPPPPQDTAAEVQAHYKLEAEQAPSPEITLVDEQETAKPGRKPPKRSYQKKAGVTLGLSGNVAHVRNLRLLKLINQAGGTYPGDKEVYYAFMTSLTKEGAEATIDWHTVRRSVKQLVDSGKLIKITFVFQDKNGLTVKKHILLVPGLKADSEQVRNLQRRMVAAYPQYHFPESVEIDQLYLDRLRHRKGVTGTNIKSKMAPEDVDDLPIEVPVPARAPVNHEPAWKQWARAEHVGGDFGQVASTPTTKRAVNSDDEAFEEEPDADQLRMQAQFQLGSYSHEPTAVPQKAVSRGVKYASRTTWFQKQKERAETARLDRERRERDAQNRQDNDALNKRESVHVEAAKDQPGLLNPTEQKQQTEEHTAVFPGDSQLSIDTGGNSVQAIPDTGPHDLISTPASQEQSHYIFGSINDISRSGFVSATQPIVPDLLSRQDTSPVNRVSSPKAATKSQAPPIFLSPDVPVKVNRKAWMWPFSRGKPGRAPAVEAVQSLTDPEQIWHVTTGTFSTEFFFHRGTRPVLKINVNSHREWEKRIPESLEEIIKLRRAGSADQMQGHAKKDTLDFIDQVDQVALWEEKNQDLTNDMSLVNPRFINFSVPDKVTAPAKYTTNMPQPMNDIRVQVAAHQAAQSLTPSQTLHGSPSRKPHTPQASTRKTRRVNAKNSYQYSTVTPEEHRRLIAAVIIVRTILGGLQRHIDWSMVSQFLPGHDPMILQSHFRAFSRTHYLQLSRLQDEFEAAFGRAYEQRLIPQIDFNDIGACDWDALITWTMQNIQIPSEEPDCELPRNRDVLEDLFEIQDDVLPDDHSWDDYFKEITTQVKRTDIIHAASFDHVLGCSKSADNDDVQTCARSLLRANAIVPDDAYDAVAARLKIEASYTEPEVDTALASLLSSGMLIAKNKGRPMPGRNFCVSDRYYQNLKRSSLDIASLQAACSAKIHLDKMLFDPESPGFFPVDYAASNGEIMLILELLANGRLHLRVDVPPTSTDPNVKPLDPVTGERHLSIWGFTVGEGHYKSTKMDRENLTFNVNAYPTATYIPGVPLQNPLPAPPGPIRMSANGRSRVPLWYDIHDRLLPDVWEGFVAMVLGAVVLRPGAGVSYIMQQMTRAIVEEWDVEVCMEWLEKLGVVDGSRKYGWKAKEWWWAVFGTGPGVD